MAEEPEALAQLARLLGYKDPGTQSPSPDAIRSLIEERFDLLLDGLLTEASASDDVLDRDSAMSFIEARLRFLTPPLTVAQSSRLRDAARERTASW